MENDGTYESEFTCNSCKTAAEHHYNTLSLPPTDRHRKGDKDRQREREGLRMRDIESERMLERVRAQVWLNPTVTEYADGEGEAAAASARRCLKCLHPQLQ
jgi:hypothetical protein